LCLRLQSVWQKRTRQNSKTIWNKALQKNTHILRDINRNTLLFISCSVSLALLIVFINWHLQDIRGLSEKFSISTWRWQHSSTKVGECIFVLSTNFIAWSDKSLHISQICRNNCSTVQIFFLRSLNFMSAQTFSMGFAPGDCDSQSNTSTLFSCFYAIQR